MSHRHGTAAHAVRVGAPGAGNGSLDSLVPLSELHEVHRTALDVLRSGGGHVSIANLILELRWRGALPWPNATADALDVAMRPLVGGNLVRRRYGSAPAYELTAAGWDACRRLA